MLPLFFSSLFPLKTIQVPYFLFHLKTNVCYFFKKLVVACEYTETIFLLEKT